MKGKFRGRRPVLRGMLFAACAVLVVTQCGCYGRQALRKEQPAGAVVSRGAAPPAKRAGQVEGAPSATAPLPDAPVAGMEGAKRSPDEFRKAPRRYTLVMAGADARELFLSLAKENDLNLVLSSDVSGSVTMDIKGATATEIMDEACGLVGCRVERDGKTVRVLPLKRMTRIFRVDYLLTSRAGSGSLTASTSTGGGSATTGGSTSTAGGSSSGGESESRNIVTTEEKFDFWSGMLDEVNSLLSGGDAKAAINKAAGTLAVTDYRENLDKVDRYLRTLEARSRSGVTIETKILEITLDDRTQYGINWTALPDLTSVSLTGALSGGATARQSLSAGTTAFQVGVAGGKFDAVIDALAQSGQINVLSAPKVSTLNNQKAIIRIGRQDVFFRAVVTPATTTSAAFVTFTPDTITEGIILSVTPQIGRDGRIMLAIHPSITEKVGNATAPDGNTAPIVDVRETNTMVTVAEGQTVFIGGLMQERTQEVVRSVPLLGDIPFLGALFRNTDQTKKKTELVILITPRLLQDSNAAEIAALEQERLLRADRGYHVGGKPWVYGTKGESKGLEPWE
ncbi:MAG: secretin N-terminal domain-containing protein [Deltaproteobacteria bacterium]|nr:secretin N-terminal domain-containing protein [Deltaproteobacteria bacterium]